MELGTHLGNYQILSALGRGGMGEVWKARDTKLGRDVAIKTLPAEFARDSDRLARFEREARLLASLNHPNIGAIYGLEESGGTRFLVLELVDGETLAERLRIGAIPLEQSLALARQVAEALEAAHGKGIVHRDLKPGNIQVTSAGKVKVLDFGLAKAFGPEPVERDASTSPTVSMAHTRQGVILGTAAYMSPEQARNREIDPRTDIFSFGCVLFEMLSGRQAFGGETSTDSIAKIVAGQPPWEALPANTPPPVRALLTATLAKDPAERLQHSRDLRLFLDPSMSLTSALAASDVPALERRRWPRFLVHALAVVGVLLLGAVAAVMATAAMAPRQITGLQWFDRDGNLIGKPYSIQNTTTYREVALSPDARQAAVAALVDGNFDIYLVNLDSGASLRVTTHASDDLSPMFSPEGKRIIFLSTRDGRRQVYETAATGTDAVPMNPTKYEDAPTGISGDGQSVVFSRVFPGRTQLFLLPLSGVKAPVLLVERAFTMRMARLSPDGLFLAYRTNETGIDQIVVQSVEERSTSRWPVSANGGTEPKWCGKCGELFFIDPGGNLIAVPYNTSSGFESRQQQTLFKTGIASARLRDLYKQYDVTADGKAFLMILEGYTPPGPLSAIGNWLIGIDSE